ncbi:hypothetical protein WR25_04494 [Diploscapter pachys]|uniref:CDK5RAP1-like protein n=1 Tax=Diploscapter pachys TaxID=2018661 RepID=A0A2A2LFZ1_9BILA|nr:hypothetical protein WR25_04494 [Diploscapter pachys]
MMLQKILKAVKISTRLASTSPRSEFSILSDADISYFERILPKGSVKTDTEDVKEYNIDWMKQYEGYGKCVLLPTHEDQISEILKYCMKKKLALVPQAGNTGLVGGSIPVHDEIVLSVKKLKNFRDFDREQGVLTCDAGFILHDLDEYIKEFEYMMPFNLGAKGSCLIGGNIATCAGGIRLLRYGSLHAHLLGLHAAIPNEKGEVLRLGSTLPKDNTSLHLHHLFLGSEGQLGVITRVTLKTVPRPKSVQSAMLGTNSFKNVRELLALAKIQLAEILSSFEFLDRDTMNCLEDNLQLKDVLPTKSEFNVLVETSGSNSEHDKAKVENFLQDCMDKKLIDDGILAESVSEAQTMWRLREDAPMAVSRDGYVFKHDLSLPLEHFYELTEACRDKFGKMTKRISTYGHVGDGNTHLNITINRGDDREQLYKCLYPFIYEWTVKHGGSISAEHGIGRMKRPYAHLGKDSVERDTVIRLKKLFDPSGPEGPTTMFFLAPKLPYSTVIRLSFRRYVAPTSLSSNAKPQRRTLPDDGKTLHDFIAEDAKRTRKRHPNIVPSVEETNSYLDPELFSGKVHYITYGCQMNVNDMEIVRSVMKAAEYTEVDEIKMADVVLLMTCSIRDGAEQKVKTMLHQIKKNSSKKKFVGVLGCMAERVKHELIERGKLVDVVAGPDSYRDLPRLLAVARGGSSAINVQLSLDETYADVVPVRQDEAARTAYVSIMRGCDNMCTYCIVPYTRGRERSRPIDSIVEEVIRLRDEGTKQVTLLGQNVNSYRDLSESVHSYDPSIPSTSTVPGFKTVYKPKIGGRTFLHLLDRLSNVTPEVRFRFTSPHPKDFPLELIHLIRDRKNICNQLHLPAQSGDDQTLERMGRGYTKDLYLRLVHDIREVLPEVSFTSDFIAGFCGETEEAHQNTVDLVREVKYSFIYSFPYSMRGKTKAHRQLQDDVPDDVKTRRHQEILAAFREEAEKLNQKYVDTTQLVLVEGTSRRNENDGQGRADCGTKVIFPNSEGIYKPGDFVNVQITAANSQTLRGEALGLGSL